MVPALIEPQHQIGVHIGLPLGTHRLVRRPHRGGLVQGQDAQPGQQAGGARIGLPRTLDGHPGHGLLAVGQAGEAGEIGQISQGLGLGRLALGRGAQGRPQVVGRGHIHVVSGVGHRPPGIGVQGGGQRSAGPVGDPHREAPRIGHLAHRHHQPVTPRPQHHRDGHLVEGVVVGGGGLVELIAVEPEGGLVVIADAQHGRPPLGHQAPRQDRSGVGVGLQHRLEPQGAGPHPRRIGQPPLGGEHGGGVRGRAGAHRKAIEQPQGLSRPGRPLGVEVIKGPVADEAPGHRLHQGRALRVHRSLGEAGIEPTRRNPIRKCFEAHQLDRAGHLGAAGLGDLPEAGGFRIGKSERIRWVAWSGGLLGALALLHTRLRACFVEDGARGGRGQQGDEAEDGGQGGLPTGGGGHGLRRRGPGSLAVHVGASPLHRLSHRGILT